MKAIISRVSASMRNKFKSITDKNLSENLFMLFMISMIILIFVYTLRNIALAVHDDISNYINMRTNTLASIFSERIPMLLFRGRLSISQIFAFVARWGIFNLGNMTVYIIYFYLLIVFNAGLLAYIIAKRTSKYIGFMIIPLYFSFAQINFQHNLFVSYPFTIHMYFLAFLISIEFFLRHFERSGKYDLIISAFFLFVSFLGYEAFLTYFALFPSYILIRSFDNKTLRSFHKNMFVLKYHALAVFAYLAYYFVSTRILFDGSMQYDGTNIDFDLLSISSISRIIFSFATDMTPLLDFLRHGFFRQFQFSQISLYIYIMAICVTILTCFILTKKIDIDGKKVAFICILSVVATFVFPMLHSVTVHSYNFIFLWGQTGFIPSFFGYYWIIIIGVMLVTYIYKILGYKKILLILIAPAIFLTTLFTAFSNAHFIETHENNLIRYRAFSNMVNSEYFAGIEDGAHIYLRGYIGVHHNLYYLVRYAREATGKTFNFTTTRSSIEHVENRYFLMYNTNNSFVLVGRIEYGLVGSEIFVIPNEPIQNGGFIGFKSSGESTVTVNGEISNIHGKSINIPIPYVGREGILIEGNGLHLDRALITNTRIFSNEINMYPVISLNEEVRIATAMPGILQGGWSPTEFWGVWSDGYTAEFGFGFTGENVNDLDVQINLTAFPDPTVVNVYVNDNFVAVYDFPHGHNTVTIPLSKEYLVEDIGMYFALIRLEIENPYMPQADANDRRRLGVGLISFWVLERDDL